MIKCKKAEKQANKEADQREILAYKKAQREEQFKKQEEKKAEEAAKKKIEDEAKM